ncbi:MAG: metal ABC transporter permease [Ruminococcaceae bacterium]|nr:metal ABC transporter permease [Oscillospiraceae bacterium]
MSNIIQTILSYGFLSRALIAGLLISVCASLLGVTLVLKRYSMIGDGLSHISFGALAFASVMGMAPLKLAIPVVAIAAIALLRLGGKKIKGDSLIAIISSSALALGIMLISYSGTSADMNSYLIGSLYAVSKSDMMAAVVLCVIAIGVFTFLYNRIFTVTFDEDFSKATGVRVGFYNTIIAVLISITVVIGMRLMGSLLISALIVFPALSSMRVFKSFKAVTISSAIISIVSFLAGFCLTLFLDGIPTGACITIVNLIIFVVLSAIKMIR